MAGRVKEKIDDTLSIFDKMKDNIAWVLGLPAAFAGSFGFLWDSSNDEAALSYQVQQLEEAVDRQDEKATLNCLSELVPTFTSRP